MFQYDSSTLTSLGGNIPNILIRVELNLSHWLWSVDGMDWSISSAYPSAYRGRPSTDSQSYDLDLTEFSQAAHSEQ